MAKKKATVKKAVGRDADATTYSTRLRPDEGKTVDAAARLLNLSTAKFLREAILARSKDLLIARSGRNRTALENLASEVRSHLTNPSVRLKGYFDQQLIETECSYYDLIEFLERDSESGIFVLAFNDEFSHGRLQELCYEHGGEPWDCAGLVRPHSVELIPMSADRLRELRQALDMAGSEFACILSEELSEMKPGRIFFSPAIDESMLLNDSSNDAE